MLTTVACEQSPGARPTDEQYQAFIAQMLDDGLLPLFRKYPVLGRLVATAAEFWVDSIYEFIERLAADWASIHTTFQSSLGEERIHQPWPDRVVQIDCQLSDPHYGGRSVLALTFASGWRLIYKPRDVGPDIAYGQLLAWIQQVSPDQTFKIITVLPRTDYGWVEFITHESFSDQSAAARYYQRAGMHLCLMYVLGGTDCHKENVIAHGEHPVLIDLETLFHPIVRAVGDEAEVNDAYALASEHLWFSVLGTGLLPVFNMPSNGEISDVSGLGGVPDQQADVRVPVWRDVNTDQMALHWINAPRPITTNTPLLDGKALSPFTYVDDIVAGFEQLYHLLIARRDELVADAGPLGLFARARVRFIFRLTQLYGRILQRSLQPQYLHDGRDLSIQLELLARAFLADGSDHQHLFWSLLRAEVQALDQVDIPHFTVFTDADSLLVAPGIAIQHCMKEPAFAAVVARVRRLDQGDLQQQIAIIRSSFYARTATVPERSINSTKASEETDGVEWCASEAFEQVSRIADEIEQRAIRSTDGSVAWIAIACGEHLVTHLAPTDSPFRSWPTLNGKALAGFSHGTAGIAYALLRLHAVTGDQTLLAAAEESCAYERGLLDREAGNWFDLRFVPKKGEKPAFMTSWCHGAPGIALARLGSLPVIDSPELRDEIDIAVQTTQLFSTHGIDHLCCGNFGRLETLVAASERLTRPDLLADARQKAAQRIRQANKLGGFNLFGQLYGAMHNPNLFQGTAGIGYELLRLAAPPSLPSLLLWE